MRMENNEVCFLGCRGPAFGFEQYVLPFTDRILRRKPIGQHLVPARLDSMAGSLNVLRLASHVLIALVRIHDRLIHVRKPLVMFVVHRSMVASTTDISTQSVLCEAANFVLSGHEMVNQLLAASEVETVVRGDMDNEVCECAVSILETTDFHFGCTPRGWPSKYRNVLPALVSQPSTRCDPGG